MPRVGGLERLDPCPPELIRRARWWRLEALVGRIVAGFTCECGVALVRALLRRRRRAIRRCRCSGRCATPHTDQRLVRRRLCWLVGACCSAVRRGLQPRMLYINMYAFITIRISERRASPQIIRRAFQVRAAHLKKNLTSSPGRVRCSHMHMPTCACTCHAHVLTPQGSVVPRVGRALHFIRVAAAAVAAVAAPCARSARLAAAPPPPPARAARARRRARARRPRRPRRDR